MLLLLLLRKQNECEAGKSTLAIRVMQGTGECCWRWMLETAAVGGCEAQMQYDNDGNRELETVGGKREPKEEEEPSGRLDEKGNTVEREMGIRMLEFAVLHCSL